MSGFTKKQLLDDSKFLRSMAVGGLDGSADNKDVWDRLDAIAERLESILVEEDELERLKQFEPPLCPDCRAHMFDASAGAPDPVWCCTC